MSDYESGALQLIALFALIDHVLNVELITVGRLSMKALSAGDRTCELEQSRSFHVNKYVSSLCGLRVFPVQTVSLE